jgi:AhpD family alkylhydroperoxidase
VPGLWDSLRARSQVARTLARHIEAVDGGTVPRRTKELVALVVAWLNACESCAKVHGDAALQLGVDEATLQELGDFARSERFSPPERAALAAAVALTREPRAMPPPVRDELERYYDAGEIVEIVVAVGLHNYLTRVSNALRDESAVTPSR